MNTSFSLTLNQQEKEFLHSLVLLRIGQVLQQKEKRLPDPPASDLLRQELGAFVTLKIDGELRGCIGNLVGRGPLYATVAAMAEAAAFQDQRFPPLSEAEFPRVTVDISIMGPISRCHDPEKIVIGRHGLIIVHKNRQGLLLPQVPVEWKWDQKTFLEQTCRKAGLPTDAWKDPGAELYWFEAEVV